MARPKKEQTEEAGPPKGDSSKLVKDLRKKFSSDDEDVMSWDLSNETSPTNRKEFISTGSTLLDYAISNRRDGGVPTGKLTEIAGGEASGKSLLCAHLIANNQKKGGISVYIDTENAANPEFMEQLGVDLSKLVYLQTGTVEKTFETIESVIVQTRTLNSSCPVLIMWDGIAATPPQSEIEGDYDPNSRIGVMAKALAKGMRKLTQTVGKERITLVVTNQLKEKPGVSYGDPFYTPGGRAIPYHASVRIRLTSSTKLKDAEGNVYAIRTRGACIKTRLGPPHRKCEFEIHFDVGVDDMGSWFTYLHERKVIEKRNGWCYIPNVDGTELQFREKEWRKMLREKPEFKSFILDLLESMLTVVYKDIDEREAIPVTFDEDGTGGIVDGDSAA